MRYVPHKDVNVIVSGFIELGWTFENQTRHFIVKHPTDPNRKQTFPKGYSRLTKGVKRKLDKALRIAREEASGG